MLEISGLYKSFNQKKVVDGVSFSVREGETVILTGPSGSGKSTTLRCINRLIEPDEGGIYLNDIAIHRLKDEGLSDVRRRMGFVFQRFNLIGRLNALDNVILPLLSVGIARDEAIVKSLDVLTRVGLEEHRYKKPSEMSGGQQQRLGIARALVTDPDVMLWDEPTASLDPILVSEVLDLMVELVNETNKTMVIVTHEMRFAIEAADRILLLENGKIVEEGEPEEVFNRPKSEIGLKYSRLVH